MPAKLEAEEQKLLKVFSDEHRFEIPDYQRPYSWTTEQTGELLEDLLNAMPKNGKIEDAFPEDASPYFLGSIVIIKEGTKSEVVDGQQRLTTLTLLFCVLRELSRELSEDLDLVTELDEYVRQKPKIIKGTKELFRLTLRERDRDFFQKNIQQPAQLRNCIKKGNIKRTDSQQRMFENVKYLWSDLSDRDEEQRKRLAIFLVQHCYLVVVSASDRNSAYRIFSVLNDRGLDLSPTDILKAETIGAMAENSRSKYTDEWESIEEELGRDNFRSLFAHIRMIYMKVKGQKELSAEFREGVLKQVPENENFINDVLSPYSDAYKIVSRAAYESSNGAEKVNRYLKHLTRLDNSDWIPPAMAFFNRNKGNTAELIQFTRDLERLAYGMFITRKNINHRISRYARVLHAIEKNEDLFGDDRPLQLSSQEKEEILRVLNGPIYPLPSVPKPLLLRLDSLVAEKGASYDHSVITIEHVLPQNPKEDSEWIKWFPDEEEREEWTHKIANLVLLSRRKNTRASNFEFKRKKDEYFCHEGVTPFALTTQVVSEPKWTPEVLEQRQKDLIKRLKKEWRLD